MRELDPELPVYDVRTMNEHIESNLLFRRIPARMFAVLGPLLLVLAAIGIYGVVAYTVSLRRNEIGVRLALGASGERVVRQFVGESLGVIGAGALVGWVLAAVVVLDLLAGGTLDAPVFSIVPALLLTVATFACWMPARRASTIDPWSVLRQE